MESLFWIPKRLLRNAIDAELVIEYFEGILRAYNQCIFAGNLAACINKGKVPATSES
jgi:hypothetical protein